MSRFLRVAAATMDEDDAASLEKELLAAAGRTDKSRSPLRRPSATPSDGHNDDDEEEDDALFYEEDRNPTSAGTGNESDASDDQCNPPSSASPGAPQDFSSSSDISFGSDLYRDDQDRAYLASLPELHRERILADRADRLESHRERSRLFMNKKISSQDSKVTPSSSATPASNSKSVAAASTSLKDNNTKPTGHGRRRRHSSNEEEVYTTVSPRASAPSSASGRFRVLPRRKEKAEILSSLVALKQSKDRDRDSAAAMARKRKKMQSSDEEYFKEEEEEEDEEGTEENHGRIRSKDMAMAAATAAIERRSCRDAEREVQRFKGGDGEWMEDRLDLAEFEDVVKITVPRSKLIKWLSEPYFDDTITGCFVRLGVGSASSPTGYLLSRVKSVESAGDASRSYQLGNRMTHKYLICSYGDKLLHYSMACVSDKPPTVDEFSSWFREHHLQCSSRGATAAQPLTKAETEEKLASINSSLVSFVYSADTVKRMLEEKKKMGGVRPFNLAAEKDRVAREVAIAEMEGAGAESAAIGRLKEQLRRLEDMAEQRRAKDAKAMALAEMNRRNREENFRAASERKARRPGQEGYDPFSRRWTRSHNYYSAVVADEDRAAGGGDSVGGAAPASELERQRRAGATVPFDPAQVHRTLHLSPIDLSRMHKFGRGAAAAALAFMEKQQRLERKYSVAAAAPGAGHAHALTVNDYKRRMNLL